MRQFISLLMLMGHLNQIDIKEYLRTDPITATSIFPSVMPRGILVFDNSEYVSRREEDYDPFFKVEVYIVTTCPTSVCNAIFFRIDNNMSGYKIAIHHLNELL